MKTCFIAIAAAMAILSTAEARLGWTLQQCRDNYGHEVKVENAWCGGTAYGFIHDNLYIYIIFSWDGRAGDLIYFDNRTAKPLSAAMCAQLWSTNVDKGRVWEDALYPDWDGRRIVKRLGAEPYVHWLIYEANGPNVVVANPHNDGWQIRTMSQFLMEQKVVRTHFLKT